MLEHRPGAFQRHPLAFLVEAADDISYAIVDLEDAVDQRLLDPDAAGDLLLPIARRSKAEVPDKYKGRARLERLRAYSMQALVDSCTQVFVDRIDEILAGDLHQSLIDLTESNLDYATVKDAVARTAYRSEKVLQIEVAGFQVIQGLLNIFVNAFATSKRTPFDKKILGLVPESYLSVNEGDPEDSLDRMSKYQRILIATDYVSGMTDDFAVDLYQKLSGIRLPS